MFDFVSKHKRLLQFVHALMIVPPFAFWGIQWTQRETAGAGEVASVGGQKITDQEFGEALRQQQERVRGLLKGNYDPAIFDSPALRLELLEGMISQRLMMQHATRNYLTVSDEMLVETTRAIPAFQVDGKFSRDRYDAALRNERMSSEAFDAALRRDLLMQQLTGALAESGLASKAVSRQFAQLRAQQREIAEYRIQADAQLAQSKITADAIRAFYDGNPAQAESDQRPRRVGFRLPHHQDHGHQGGENEKPRICPAGNRARAEKAAGRQALCRSRGGIQQPGLRAARVAGTGRGKVQAHRAARSRSDPAIRAGAGAEQRQAARGAVRRRFDQEPAQHRGDRNVPGRSGFGARAQSQAVQPAPVRRSEGRHSQTACPAGSPGAREETGSRTPRRAEKGRGFRGALRRDQARQPG